MPKEMPTPVASEIAVKKNKKFTSKPKKSGQEIDDIFSSKKGKKELDEAEKPVKNHKTPTSEQKKPGNEIGDILLSNKGKKEVDVVAKPVKKQKKSASGKKNPTPEQKKPGNEIEEIFLSKKKRKKELEEIEKQQEDSIKKNKKIRKYSKVPDGDGFVDPPPRPRKKTGEGYVVYTEEELGITKEDGGDTSLCPFDCSCCF